jgi:hypothetical protein
MSALAPLRGIGRHAAAIREALTDAVCCKRFLLPKKQFTSCSVVARPLSSLTQRPPLTGNRFAHVNQRKKKTRLTHIKPSITRL